MDGNKYLAYGDTVLSGLSKVIKDEGVTTETMAEVVKASALMAIAYEMNRSNNEKTV